MAPSAGAYTRTQVLLHWAVAVLVAAQLFLAGAMETAFEARMRGFAIQGPVLAGAWAHIAFGGAILGLMSVRLWLRLRTGVPPPPDSLPPTLRRLTRWVHRGFYLILLTLPLSGALAWGGRVGLAATLHSALISVLFALLAAHLAGFAAHLLLWRDARVGRMFRPGNEHGRERR